MNGRVITKTTCVPEWQRRWGHGHWRIRGFSDPPQHILKIGSLYMQFSASTDGTMGEFLLGGGEVGGIQNEAF